MAINWIKPLQWLNKGSEPSDNLKKTGFQTGYKPPADVFNFFLGREEECIEQLQTEAQKAFKGISISGKTLRATDINGGQYDYTIEASEKLARWIACGTQVESGVYGYVRLGDVSTTDKWTYKHATLLIANPYSGKRFSAIVEVIVYVGSDISVPEIAFRQICGEDITNRLYYVHSTETNTIDFYFSKTGHEMITVYSISLLGFNMSTSNMMLTEIADNAVQGGTYSSVPHAKAADSAAADGEGKNIVDTYAKKADLVCYKYDNINKVIETGVGSRVFVGALKSSKTLDNIVSMGLIVEFTNDGTTITFGYTANKSNFATQGLVNNINTPCVNLAFVSPAVSTDNSFTQNQINATLYLENETGLYLAFNDGAYSQFNFDTNNGQCHNLSSGKFTLKSAIYYAI